MRTRLFCFLSLAITATAAVGAEPAFPFTRLSTFESLVTEWARIRLQIADEKRDWNDKEAAWQTELELLRTEVQSLQKAINDLTQSQDAAQKSQAEFLAGKERMEAALAALPPILDRAEAHLRELARAIPRSLLAPLDKPLREMPSTPAEGVRLPVSRRLQIVISLYTQIETLQHNVHIGKETLALAPNRSREMDVLYLGLARGFAVSSDDRTAAVGTPSSDGWKWTPNDAIGPAARRAIAVFNRERVAELVDLPLQSAPNKTPSESGTRGAQPPPTASTP
ncbi:MAG: DUF3450 family protein [Verrucomicrobiota bacterium]|nr:DUF3450 family protein [Verrucomicrobiota bacterium]